MLARRPPALRRDQLDVDGTGQPGGDLVLRVKEAGMRLVEAFGPQMRPALGIDELRIDPDPVVRVLHAAFEDEADAEFATDLAGVDRLALVSEGGAARDYEKPRSARGDSYQRFRGDVHERVVVRPGADR